MKIAVICANGKAGSLIVKEGINRGLDVVAVVRGENKTIAKKVIKKDLFNLTYSDIEDCDVVIDAFGTWTPEMLKEHETSLEHLCNMLSEKENRLLIVGGAGSLYINKEHTMRVMDSEEFPEAFMPLATVMGKALDTLRKRNDVKWTYISPAGDFRADGERMGEYTLGGEELVLNSKGESTISYADYAIAMIDEATKGNHLRERISVVSK